MILDARKHKNEKYLYLKMGYLLARANGGEIKVEGNVRNETRYFVAADNGTTTILHEIKYVRKGVMARRSYDVYSEGPRMIIEDHLDARMVNRGKIWDDRFQFEDAIALDTRGIS